MQWVLFALSSAFVGALVAVLAKAGLKEVEPSLGLAVQSVLILALSWGTVAVKGDLGALGQISRQGWLYLLLSGLAAGVSYLLLFRALKLGSAARVVPLDRLSLVFAMILAAVFLKEKIGGMVIVGGALMVLGALLVAAAAE